MAKLFSIASWNVEHFKGEGRDSPRVDRVVAFLADREPDLFALYEVEGATVFRALVDRMPGYTFQITEGTQTQEILVGVRRDLTAFITQKTEYRSGTTHMRPGQLVTLSVGGSDYAVLFLHVASGVDPRGMGLRDDMVQRALDFRKALEKQNRRNGGDGVVNYLFLGDLNSMGMEYPFDRAITAEIELAKWEAEASRLRTNKMVRLTKTHPNSWSNGTGSTIPDSNLDHVFATDNLRFRAFTGASNGEEALVKVEGWVDETTDAAKDRWIADHSDHSLLYLEVLE